LGWRRVPFLERLFLGRPKSSGKDIKRESSLLWLYNNGVIEKFTYRVKRATEDSLIKIKEPAMNIMQSLRKIKIKSLKKERFSLIP